MFGSCRKLPRIPQPGPQANYFWCSIHQHFLLAADAVSGGPGVFQLQSSRLTMQAESSDSNFDGLFNFSLVRCW